MKVNARVATEEITLCCHTLETEYYLLIVHEAGRISRENPINDGIHVYVFVVKLNLRLIEILIPQQHELDSVMRCSHVPFHYVFHVMSFPYLLLIERAFRNF
jgi:hypothetical protein